MKLDLNFGVGFEVERDARWFQYLGFRASGLGYPFKSARRAAAVPIATSYDDENYGHDLPGGTSACNMAPLTIPPKPKPHTLK